MKKVLITRASMVAIALATMVAVPAYAQDKKAAADEAVD
ncbi:MAG: hypothetical protein RL367_2486, partial [Pseudomonadota bacterium]